MWLELQSTRIREDEDNAEHQKATNDKGKVFARCRLLRARVTEQWCRRVEGNRRSQDKNQQSGGGKNMEGRKIKRLLRSQEADLIDLAVLRYGSFVKESK